MNNFTIKRSEWFRGNPIGVCLLDGHNRKCCLGFFSLACGLTENQIEGLQNPSEVVESNHKITLKDFPDWVFIEGSLINSKDIKDLITINDSIEIDDSEREVKIKDIFAKHNITVEFED